MPYYKGDFYRPELSGLRRGDPGFWGSVFGLAKTVAGSIPGVGAVGKLGAAVATIKGAIRPGAARIGRAVSEHPVLTAAGAAGIAMTVGAGAEHRMLAGAPGAKGFHPCKSRHGCKTGAMVRNRHMRVTNPRALRRALRRVGGFGRIAKRVMRLTHPHHKGRYVMKFPKRKRAA